MRIGLWQMTNGLWHPWEILGIICSQWTTFAPTLKFSFEIKSLQATASHTHNRTVYTHMWLLISKNQKDSFMYQNGQNFKKSFLRICHIHIESAITSHLNITKYNDNSVQVGYSNSSLQLHHCSTNSKEVSKTWGMYRDFIYSIAHRKITFCITMTASPAKDALFWQACVISDSRGY